MNFLLYHLLDYERGSFMRYEQFHGRIESKLVQCIGDTS